MPSIIEVVLLGLVCILGSTLVLLGMAHHSISTFCIGVFEIGVAYLLTTVYKFGEKR